MGTLVSGSLVWESLFRTFSFGNLVACKTSSLMKTKSFFSQPSKPIIIDRVSSFDLDNKEDLLIMRRFYEKN